MHKLSKNLNSKSAIKINRIRVQKKYIFVYYTNENAYDCVFSAQPSHC